MDWTGTAILVIGSAAIIGLSWKMAHMLFGGVPMNEAITHAIFVGVGSFIAAFLAAYLISRFFRL